MEHTYTDIQVARMRKVMYNSLVACNRLLDRASNESTSEKSRQACLYLSRKLLQTVTEILK